MDRLMPLFESGRTIEGMQKLCILLREKRRMLPPGEWRAWVKAEGRAHSVRSIVHQDAITFRAFSWPRGYPGDAETLDLIYAPGRAEVAQTTSRACDLALFTNNAPAAQAVRWRRHILAQIIDATARTTVSPRVLALAAGHLREAELSRALQERAVAQFVAIDQDAESLRVIERDYGELGISVKKMTVKGLLNGQDGLEPRNFDLVYAAGLFDYLTQSTAERLAALMMNYVAPGGRLLIANFLPDIYDVGYMECFMNWFLVYRNLEQLRAVLNTIPKHLIEGIDLYTDPFGTIGYVIAQRSQS